MLVGAVSTKHDVSGFKEDVKIQQDGLASDIVDIEHNTSPIVRVIPTCDLPKSGNTGLSREISVEVAPISKQLLAYNRSWTDEAHFSPDNVPQLRQLIEACTSQEPSDACDTRVVAKLMVPQPFGPQLRVTFQKLPQHAVRIRNHTAEFQAIESFAVATNAAVAKYDRTALTPKEDGNSQNQRRKYNTKESGAQNIQCPLKGVPYRPPRDNSLGNVANRVASPRGIILLDDPKALPCAPPTPSVNPFRLRLFAR